LEQPILLTMASINPSFVIFLIRLFRPLSLKYHINKGKASILEG